MSTEMLLPNTRPALLYPKVYGVKPKRKHYRCKRCGSNNRSRLISISNEGYRFQCDWCDQGWFVAASLVINEVFQDQVRRFSEMTQKSGKEVGGLLMRTKDGIVVMDMEQMGEERQVSMSPTRKLRPGEEILGTWHSHPVTDRPSWFDVATFRRDKWEQISCVSGAEGTLTVMIKTPETVAIKPEELEGWVKKCQDEGPELKDVGKEYNFLIYRGSPGELKLVSGEGRSLTLEKLVKGVRGVKNL